MNSKHIKYIFLCTLIAAVIISMCATISASTLSNFYPDSDAGWTLYSTHSHMGSTSTTYKYATTQIKQYYDSNLSDAKALWGSSYISMTEVSSGNIGTITRKFDTSDTATATTKNVTFNSSTNHRTGWEIEVNGYKFDGNGVEGKARTLAHEIGHVYGLDHVASSSQIMYAYYSETKNVTSNDQKGISICTDQHSHSSYTYSAIDSSYHKKKCTNCKGYFKDSHTWTGSPPFYCQYCGYSN